MSEGLQCVCEDLQCLVLCVLNVICVRKVKLHHVFDASRAPPLPVLDRIRSL